MRARVIGRFWLAFAAIVGPARAQPAIDIPTKQVAAPPADILDGVVRLPEPDRLATRSRTALLRVEPARVWSRPLEPGTRVVFLPGPDARWRIDRVAPARSDDRPDSQLPLRPEPIVSNTSGGPLAPGRSFETMRVPADAEGWSVRIEPGATPGFVLVERPGDVVLDTYPTALGSLVGRRVTLRSELSHGARIESTIAEVRTPSGREFVVDTPGADASFVPDEPGDHAVLVRVLGVDADNRSVELTTQHLIAVAEPAPALAQPTVAVADGVATLTFAAGAPGRRSILAAEVWGTRAADDRPVPVCFLARVCGTPRSLDLDLRWVALAGVDPGSLELRSVRAHDVDSLCIVASEPVVRCPLPIGAAIPPAPRAVTPEMLAGIPGNSSVRVDGLAPTPRSALPGHRLMLVHGYCSEGDPFATDQFTGDIAEFIDADQSRSNDAFALELLAQSAPMKSFGVAAHSQGGMASLHLSTFYWSGMDWSQGERLIQSVGTPYQGTALAGNAAVLGQLFGTGCGSNNDMTYTGAALWLSTIPTWARQRVWYWTTSFEDRPFVYDYCNFISDLLLADPDDGVIEQAGGQLPGANNMGHRTGWCHTAGMRDPAQCTDAQRNTEIDQRARR